MEPQVQQVPVAAPETVGALLRQAAAALREAGADDAGHEARRLMQAVTGLTPAEMLARPERPLAPAQAPQFAASLARRLAGEPITRILGRAEFYGRSFALSPATLEPRPDSETLIAAALDLLRAEQRADAPLRLLDVGTGTGCLLLTLLRELPNATGLGTDISAAALDVARANARALGVEARATWQMADALGGVSGPFDLLVSNPPYVRSADVDALAPAVRNFDPRTALDGGPDGLRVYARLFEKIAGVIPNGWIVLEVGYDQADAVATQLRAALGGAVTPWQVHFYQDVAGRRRCVAVRTRN